MVILIVGLLGYVVGANLTGPGSALSIAIVGLTLLAAVGEAAFLEWTKWAPHEPPALLVERQDWPGYAGVIVTNNDVQGRFRASIIEVSGPNGSLRWGPNDLWPLQLAWGDAKAPERHLIRGEREAIRLVQFAGSDNGGGQERYFAFPGAAGMRILPLVAPDGTEQRDLEVAIQYVRISPPSEIVRTERISYPRDSSRSAIS